MLHPKPARSLDACGTKLPLDARTLIMGIVNVTPDSFSDGGLFLDPAAAVAGGKRLVQEGADMVDVGGESTRPGHHQISAQEEISRAIPVVEALVKEISVPISIDTYKAVVAERALEGGATIVNDVWGLQRDPDIAGVAAAHGAVVVIMHNREQIDPSLDIMGEMRAFYGRSIERAKKAGVRDDRIVLDPGIGFGKSPEQNLSALKHLNELDNLGYPILLGVSRKSFINRLYPSEPRERLPGTVAANMAGIFSGVSIIRVHDVAAHVQAVRVADAIRSAR
jgi:dihydropteroate synthase